MQIYNMAVLATEAAVYFMFLITLLHWRHRIGIGVFIAVLGTMHFLETYLASTFYVPVPMVAISPGSAVLFAGKLLMVLLLYIKEDAATVRQLIYGLLIGNVTILVLGLILQLHVGVRTPDGALAEPEFLQSLGILMVWGTSLLYVDSIAIILLYERLGGLVGRQTLPRLFLAGALVLTFDQIGFYGVLHWLTGAPASVFWGGFAAKMAMNALFVLMTALYLSFSRSATPSAPAKALGDIFNDLTYRERYQDLLEQSGRDALTGVHDRGRLEAEGPEFIRQALSEGTALSLMMVDADHFKALNDLHGHLRGDEVLKQIASALSLSIRKGGRVYRFGGEEFAVICRGLGPRQALEVAERMRLEIGKSGEFEGVGRVTASIGIATVPEDGASLLELISAADRRLYRAKAEGRNRVFGG